MQTLDAAAMKEAQEFIASVTLTPAELVLHQERHRRAVEAAFARAVARLPAHPIADVLGLSAAYRDRGDWPEVRAWCAKANGVKR